jgi:hypothetical protein
MSITKPIIGGVITSTLLTLVVVPVVYTYLDRLHVWRKSKHAATTETARTAGAPAPGD